MRDIRQTVENGVSNEIKKIHFDDFPLHRMRGWLFTCVTAGWRADRAVSYDSNPDVLADPIRNL